MTQQDFEEYIRSVAAKYHLTPEAVLQDIENCIAESYRGVVTSGDPALLAEWRGISQTGTVPTPYEFITYAAQAVLRQRKDK